MTGTRFSGLLCQHRLALEIGRNGAPTWHHKGGDHEAQSGFASQYVNDN